MSLGNTKQVSSIPRLYPLFEHVSFCVCQLGTVVAMECIAKGPPTTEFSICFQCNDTGRVILKFHVNFNTTSVIRSYQREDCRYIFEDIKKTYSYLLSTYLPRVFFFPKAAILPMMRKRMVNFPSNVENCLKSHLASETKHL